VSRKKIEQAVARSGWTLDYLEWEPLGIVMEKCGQSGGWRGRASNEAEDREADVLGYNWQQAVAWFEIERDKAWLARDPFACADVHSSRQKAGDCMGARGHRGDHFPRADARGQGLAEYGLLLALIAVIAIAALALLGTQISEFVNALGQSI
jgi:pilus assembly protein Flp/PilA